MAWISCPLSFQNTVMEGLHNDKAICWIGRACDTKPHKVLFDLPELLLSKECYMSHQTYNLKEKVNFLSLIFMKKLWHYSKYYCVWGKLVWIIKNDGFVLPLSSVSDQKDVKDKKIRVLNSPHEFFWKKKSCRQCRHTKLTCNQRILTLQLEFFHSFDLNLSL
jgi:hypothetical protein